MSVPSELVGPIFRGSPDDVSTLATFDIEDGNTWGGSCFVGYPKESGLSVLPIFGTSYLRAHGMRNSN